MKKNLLSLLLAVIAGVSAYINFGKTEIKPIAKKRKSLPQTFVRQNLKQSKYIISKSSEVASAFPAECKNPLIDLSAMSSEESIEVIKSTEAFRQFFSEACMNGLRSNEMFKNIQKNAKCELLEAKGKPSDTCFTMLFMLKAYFIVEHTLEKTPEDMSSQELAANFVKMFFGLDKLTKEDFKNNLKIIDTLHRMHPNDPDVLEAYVGYMMIGRQITLDASVDSRIDQLMENAEGNSFKVDRLQALRDMINNDNVGAEESLARLALKYPHEPEVAYYQAAYHWRQGDRAAADAFLDKAIQFGDQCSYCVPAMYKDTKKRLARAKDKDQNLFSISVGLNFENL